MVYRRSSKFKKQRGTTTHGYGTKDRHGSAGHRGGRGKACGVKMLNAKKFKPLNTTLKYGQTGFKSISQRLNKFDSIINLLDVERNFDSFLTDGIITKEKDLFVCDLKKAGYDKLLGKGILNHKMKFIVDVATKKAISKVEELKGEVVLSN
jgi:large subunit ribosomal protein L15